MSDGFASPDPADTPDDDGVRYAESLDGDELRPLSTVRAVGDDVSCSNCVHAAVCAYRDGVASMLEGRDGNPFDADELAAICDAFEFEEPDE